MAPMIKELKSLFEDQRIRFLIVGGINTIVGYGAFAFFIWAGLHYFYANVLSTTIAVANSYILNKYFTFKQPKKSAAEAVRFVSVYIISFILGNVVLYILVDRLSVTPYLAGLCNLVFTTLISWFGHKYFSFKTGKI
jgi:putative flippase GtrA